jgi:hypothetical protein
LQQHHLLLRLGHLENKLLNQRRIIIAIIPAIIITITIAAAKAWWVIAWIAAFSRVPLWVCCAAADGRTDQQCA